MTIEKKSKAQVWLSKRLWLLKTISSIGLILIFSFLIIGCTDTQNTKTVQISVTSIQVQTDITKNPDSRERIKVASDVNTPKSDLAILSTDQNAAVQAKVASNPNTEKHVLAILATHKLWFIRANVAGNKNTSKKTLLVLSRDRNQSVSNIANRNLERYHYGMTLFPFWKHGSLFFNKKYYKTLLKHSTK